MWVLWTSANDPIQPVTYIQFFGRSVQRTSLITAVSLVSSCSAEGPPTSNEVLLRMNEVLVSQPVTEEFLDATARCHLYEKYSFRQVSDPTADALADIEDRHSRIVLVFGTFEAFMDQYDEQKIACVGELPPFDTIWELSPTDEDCGPIPGCCLVEDMSDRARNYGISYSSVVMDKLVEERGCD